MKKLLPFLLSFMLLSGARAQTVTTPLYNAKLTGPLDANAQVIKSAGSISFGTITPLAPSALIHLLPNGAPTTSLNGIKFGADTGIYRSATGTLSVTGNLVVSGTISGAEGIVRLAGSNIFSGANTYNGAVTFSETSTVAFNSAFDVGAGAVTAIQTNLQLLPGTNVQAYSALLLAIANLNPQAGYVIVGDGTTWTAQGGATARTSLGLGTASNVTFTNVTATGTLAVTGASTLTGKVTAAGAVSDATGLQLGSAGAFYGSGTGIVSDDPVTLNAGVVLGDNSADIVQVFGVLKLGNADDLSITRTGLAAGTLTGALTITGGATLGSPLTVSSGGTGLAALPANKIVVGSGTDTMSTTTLTTAAMGLLDDATVSDMRTTLGLGTAALVDTGTGSSNVILGNDSRLTDSRTPTGSAAGGDLAGTYPTSVTIAADAVALGTDTTGSYVQQLSAGTGVSITGTNNIETAVPIINIGQSVSAAASPTFAGLSLTGALGVVGNYTSTDGNITLTNGTLTLTNGSLVVTNGSINFPSLTVTGLFTPATSGGSALGSTGLPWSNLYLKSTGTINFGNGNLVMTHSSGILNVTTGDLRVTTAGTNAASVVTVGGAQNLTSKVLTSATVTTDLLPTTDGGAVLGSGTQQYSGLFLTTGSAITFANSLTLTHSAGLLTLSGGLVISTPGTAAGNAVTVDGAQTLSNKTLTAAKIADLGYIADANGVANLTFDTTASAVNNLQVANAGFGSSPTLSAIGSDSNISITLTPKGTGTVVATNAITPTGGVAAAGGWSVSPRTIHSGNAPPTAALSGAGTDTTPVTTTTYICEIFVPANCTITGVAVLNGSVNAGNITVSLADSTGAPIAAAKSASTASSGTNAYQRIPFASSYAAKGPATYYVMYQTDNTSNRFRTHLVGNFGTTTQTSGVYGTFVSFSPPTTFTTNVGPICSLY